MDHSSDFFRSVNIYETKTEDRKKYTDTNSKVIKSNWEFFS